MKRLKEAIAKIKDLDYKLIQKAEEKLNSLTKPQGSLGRLEKLAKQVVGIRGKEKPLMKNKVIFTFAADHGVSEEGISAFPKEVTTQMIYNFLRGGAGINVLARHVGARVVVVDMGVAEKLKISRYCRGPDKSEENGKLKIKKVNFGTKNMVKGPAMNRDEAIKSIEAGIEVVEEEMHNGVDIIGTGDMGIGNTTSSSAITSVITSRSVEDVTARGTGIDDKTYIHKVEVIKKALKINKPNPDDPIDVLSKVGGFEIGGLSGVILAAAKNRIPIVLDGFISGAASLLAYQLQPKVKDYIICGHCSQEKGHRIILDYIGLKPLLDLDLRLGEGTGAALGINIVEASIKILTQMATFESASVSERIKT